MGNTCRVGNIRPSQLLWTYGPGAMIDLPNFSVMTMGLDSWKQDKCHLIEEPRLLEQVRKMCGAQVERMLQPPVCETELDNPNDPHSYIGVPVQPFPRWFRCVKCGMMAEYDAIKGMSQDTVPYRKPVIEGMNGHACGHNLLGMGSVAGAVAV